MHRRLDCPFGWILGLGRTAVVVFEMRGRKGLRTARHWRIVVVGRGQRGLWTARIVAGRGQRGLWTARRWRIVVVAERGRRGLQMVRR